MNLVAEVHRSFQAKEGDIIEKIKLGNFSVGS
jgi:hypothetical protein